MFEEKHIPNRQMGEKLLTFLRPHILYLFSHILLFIVQLSIPFIVYYFIAQTSAQLFQGEIFTIIFILLFTLYLLVIYLMFYNNFIDYHLDIWIVTNKRIISIVQNNIFNRTIKEYPIDRIQDVAANQKGLLQTFFQFGDVTIQTAGEDDPVIFDNVPNPFKTAQTINNLLHKNINN